MAHEVFWKKKTETIWHKITSASPITWNQQIIPATQAVYPFTGGQCAAPAIYQVFYEVRTRTSRYATCNSWGAWTAATGAVGSPTLYGPIGAPRVNTYAFASTFGNMAIEFPFTAHNSSGPAVTRYLRIGGNAGSTWATNCGVSAEFRNFRVQRINGDLSDNCGNPAPIVEGSPEKCRTTFSTGLIVDDAICIDVRGTKPGCGCCSELLPKATRILGMLS